MSNRNIVISGVGKTATSYLFKNCMRLIEANRPIIGFYEPLVWRHVLKKGSEFDLLAFGVDALSIDGIKAHLDAPLFSSNDPLVGNFFDNLISEANSKNENIVLVKDIRINGRLGSILNSTDAEILLCLRAPHLILNSIMGKFSLLGEDFYPSDYPRLPDNGITFLSDRDFLTQNLRWIHSMQEVAVSVALKHPDRVFVYERDISRLADLFWKSFCNRHEIRNQTDFELKDKVGPVTQNFRLGKDIAKDILSAENAYFDLVSKITSPKVNRKKHLSEVEKKLSRLDKTPSSTVERFGSNRTALYFRDLLARQPNSQQIPNRRNPSNLGTLRKSPVRSKSKKHVIGLVMPTMSLKVASGALGKLSRQTVVPDKIQVVFDGASSEARGTLEAPPGLDVELIYTNRNIGPGGARNIGYRRLIDSGCGFISQVDDDDDLHPCKFESEIEAIGKETKIVYSDHIISRKNGNRLVEAPSEITGKTIKEFIERSRILPRDMLISREVFEAGFYYPSLHRIYEDYIFKALIFDRFSQQATKNNMNVGTIYNRSDGGLSSVSQQDEELHLCRALLYLILQGSDEVKRAAAQFLASRPFDKFTGFENYLQLSGLFYKYFNVEAGMQNLDLFEALRKHFKLDQVST